MKWRKEGECGGYNMKNQQNKGAKGGAVKAGSTIRAMAGGQGQSGVKKQT